MKTFNYNDKEHKVFDLKAFGKVYQVILAKERYHNNHTLAVEIIDVTDENFPEPFAVATVNLNNLSQSGTRAYADTNNYGKWLMPFLKEHNLASDTGARMRSGFCEYPLLEWNTDLFLAEGLEETPAEKYDVDLTCYDTENKRWVGSLCWDFDEKPDPFDDPEKAKQAAREIAKENGVWDITKAEVKSTRTGEPVLTCLSCPRETAEKHGLKADEYLNINPEN